MTREAGDPVRGPEAGRMGLRTAAVYAAALLLVQAVLVATVWISAPHNGGDNAGYVSLAHSLLTGEGYVEAWDPARPLHTKYPPVFPVLVAAAVALGARSWVGLKLVTALFTLAAGLLAWAWAAGRRGPLAGAVVAALFALSPGLLWYSHWVLSDVPFVAFTLLALWALEREGGRSRLWLGVGLAAAVLAYFTRSAGLPLLVAVAGWLALRHRWRALAAFGALAGAPALAWWLRGRGGGTDYVAEFWMVDPYAPHLGTVGPGGLAGRAWDNALLYATRHVPEGLLGLYGTPGVVLGVLLLGLAVAGWGMRWMPAGSAGEGAGPPGGATARGVHVAELFLPLYAGLVLLWPQVWSGDRFVLPLFPLVLLYAGDAVAAVARRATGGPFRPGPGRPAGAAGVAVAVAALGVAVPAGLAWAQAREGARACNELLHTVGAGPYACHGRAWDDFVEAARWSGANLPAGSTVLTRKPRIFWVMGGTPSRTYPFSDDAEEMARFAEEAGARYVLMDMLSRQGLQYVGGAVRSRPEAFCTVSAFGGAGGGASQLLGFVPPESGLGGGIEEVGGEPSVRIPPCPAALQPAREVRPPLLVGLEIPLLTGAVGGGRSAGDG